jgi:uncharacterized lipoprotein YehR (DUF1307 family)
MEEIMKNLDDSKKQIETQFLSIESASRNQESEIKLFYSKLTAKVKEREHEVLSSVQKQFEDLRKLLSTHQSEVEESFLSTKTLIKKIDQISGSISPYNLLSRI